MDNNDNNEIYELIEKEDHYTVFLKQYNVTYHYSIVRINEDKTLSYTISVDDNPEGVDTDSEEVTRVMGFVLLDLIENGVMDGNK